MKLREQISTGERVLWEGKKDTKVSVFEAIFNPLMPFALIWFIFDMGFIAVFSQEIPTDGAFLGSMIGFFALHLYDGDRDETIYRSCSCECAAGCF